MVARSVLACAGVVALVASVGPVRPAQAQAAAARPHPTRICAGTAPSDFNGDGISDAAIGDPGQRTPERVHILYGTRAGLTADPSGTALNDQFLASPGNVRHSAFGQTLVAGDFNGDGCTDLAVGDPVRPVGGVRAGVVDVFWGTVGGLVDSHLTLDETAVTGTVAGTFDAFGEALAVGDFNGDSVADLAVTAYGVGAVFIFPGSRTQAPFLGARRFTEGDGTVPGTAAEQFFGLTVAAGDFDGDGRSDLVVGDPAEDGNAGDNAAGKVFVIRGSATSALLTPVGAQIWTQDSPGIRGSSEPGDYFGGSLATGSFKGDGHVGLAIGVTYDDVGGVDGAGSVNVIYSAGAGGLGSAGNQLWTRNSPGVDGTAGAQNSFGWSVAAGDFDGNGATDLAVGVPGETVGGQVGAGSVTVLTGATNGLIATGSNRWSQATPGVPGAPGYGANFGSPLTVVRVTSSGRDDLLVGAPGKTVQHRQLAGDVELIPGSATGLMAVGAEVWNDNSTGVKGNPCFDCSFGISLA